MKRFLLAAALLFPAHAFADVDARFAKLRDSAQPLGGLGTFLEKYVGECNDIAAGAECKANAAAFRKAANGKHFYMIVTEDAATMLSPGAFDPSNDEFILNVTPFFPAAGYALTEGAPSRTDANGNPILPLMRIRAKAPEGWTASSVPRLFSMRAVRLQVVFTPKDLWSLSKKGGGKIYGVRARLEGMLVSVGRTGETIAEWFR